MNKNEVAKRLTNVSDNYIKDMIAAVEQAYHHDKSLTPEEIEIALRDGLYYGTNIHSDWGEWKELLRPEAERRGLKA